jgi:hypothetical protein
MSGIPDDVRDLLEARNFGHLAAGTMRLPFSEPAQ